MACLWCCHYSQKLLLSFVPKAHCAERYYCPHQRVIPSFYHPFYFKKLHPPTLHNFFGQFSHFGLARRKLQFSYEMLLFKNLDVIIALFKNIWANNITSSICITYYLTLPSLSPDAVRTTTTRALGAPTMPSAKKTHFN